MVSLLDGVPSADKLVFELHELSVNFFILASNLPLPILTVILELQLHLRRFPLKSLQVVIKSAS